MSKHSRIKPQASTGTGSAGPNEGAGGTQILEKSSDYPKTTGASSILAGFASIVAVVSVLTSLFGYGVVAGIAHSFGHSQEAIATSGFDLITMVWPGVLVIVTSLDKVISPELLIEVWMQTRFIALAVGIGVFLAVLGLSWLRPKLAKRFALRERVIVFFQTKKRLADSLGWATVGFLLSIATSFVMQILGAAAVIALFVVAVYVPSLGSVVGTAYVQKFVVEPTFCATPAGRSARLQWRVATQPRPKNINSSAECVLVSSLDPTKPFFRVGRLVLTSSSAVLLWNAESGNAYRTPSASMEIVSVSEDEFQQIAKMLAEYPASCLMLTGDGRKLLLKSGNTAINHCKV